MSIIQGPVSVAPCQYLISRFAYFLSALYPTWRRTATEPLLPSSPPNPVCTVSSATSVMAARTSRLAHTVRYTPTSWHHGIPTTTQRVSEPRGEGEGANVGLCDLGTERQKRLLTAPTFASDGWPSVRANTPGEGKR
jgi:hypothetical protein